MSSCKISIPSPCGFWAHHPPSITVCSPTRKLHQTYVLEFLLEFHYLGMMIKSLAMWENSVSSLLPFFLWKLGCSKVPTLLTHAWSFWWGDPIVKLPWVLPWLTILAYQRHVYHSGNSKKLFKLCTRNQEPQPNISDIILCIYPSSIWMFIQLSCL